MVVLKVKDTISVERKVKGKVISLVCEKCFTNGPCRAKWLSFEDRLWAITVHLFQPSLPSFIQEDLVMEQANCLFNFFFFLLAPFVFDSAVLSFSSLISVSWVAYFFFNNCISNVDWIHWNISYFSLLLFTFFILFSKVLPS